MNIPFVNNPEFHGTVTVAASATFGTGCVLWQYSTVCDDAVIGNNVVIGSGAWIGKRVQIGDGTRIQHGAFIPNDTVIGQGVFIGPNVSMTDDKYPRAGNDLYKPEPPVLEDGCSIGAGAVILPGVTIGKNSMVGAGAVVVQDVTAFSTVVGCPAERLIHNLDKEYVPK